MKNNDKLKKIAIFGGSFDPPHYGHLDIVKNLERAFDKVIVVPAYISPFKDEGSDAKVRFAVCKKFFASEKTEVSRKEISRGGISYSVDTAKYFAKKYRESKLYWVIGSEELINLQSWRNIDLLKTFVTFYVVSRPGYAPNAELMGALKKQKIKCVFAKFIGLDISSTVVKIDIAFDKANYAMPSVAVNALEKGLFNPYGEYVNLLHKYNLKESRIEHTYAVAKRGALLAKLYGANVTDAVVACILHDVAKSVDPTDYTELDFGDFPAPTVHGIIGSHIALTDAGVSDEIAHAIYYHSTGTANMSLLDEIVYLADKTADGRRYDSLGYLKYLCTVDRTLAMYFAVNEIAGLKDNSPCKAAVAAHDYYAELCDGKVFPIQPEKTQVNTITVKTVKTDGEKDNKTEGGKKNEKSKDKKIVSDANVPAELKGVFDIALTAANELNLHKATDVDIIDLSGKTVVADYFVIATASSSTAVRALKDYVEDILTKKFGIDPARRDTDREWVALDYGNVIVHIFTQKLREFYNIERLWSDGKNVVRVSD